MDPSGGIIATLKIIVPYMLKIPLKKLWKLLGEYPYISATLPLACSVIWISTQGYPDPVKWMASPSFSWGEVIAGSYLIILLSWKPYRIAIREWRLRMIRREPQKPVYCQYTSDKLLGAYCTWNWQWDWNSKKWVPTEIKDLCPKCKKYPLKLLEQERDFAGRVKVYLECMCGYEFKGRRDSTYDFQGVEIQVPENFTLGEAWHLRIFAEIMHRVDTRTYQDSKGASP